MTSQSTAGSIAPTALVGADRERASAPWTLPLESSTLPMFHGARPLKRWRYVAVFCDELMACAALVHVGPVRQSFWAVLTRPNGRLRERTRTPPRRGAVELVSGRSGRDQLAQGRLRVREGGVLLDLCLDEQGGIRSVCAHGPEHVWTHKQAGIRASGTLALDGGPPEQIEALAVIDDTAGYHARFTEWWWSAGVAAAPDGTPLAWNLVAGVNDPSTGSERAIWVNGAPVEAPPVSFATDLSSIHAADGAQLHFAPEAERRRRQNLVAVSYDYRAPFGVFSGTLAGGIAVKHGLGVVEHHRAHW